ncbi:MAG TPA: glycosyltransferase family 2 protein [Mycobacteriales bacterium]|nr:glycosyltransferase family 2 protein [Mycobacteriales bacterium]
MLRLLASAGLLTQAAVSLRLGRKLRATLQWLAADDAHELPADRPRIALIIPVYQEENRLTELGDRLCAIDYPDELLRIVFVSSDTDSGATGRLAQEQVERINGKRESAVAKLYSYPGPTTSMAIQLNYGLRRLRESGWTPGDQDYIGVIPADAFPRPQLLVEVARNVAEHTRSTGHSPEVLQQPTTHLRTFNALGEGFGDMVRRAAGVYQSSFALSVEVSRLRALQTRERRGWKRVYSPVSGHGLFIRGDILRQHNGFPEEPWCEDIALTFGYYCRGYDIVPLRSVEDNESPLSWPVYIRQSATWFTGASQFPALIRFARRAAPGTDTATLAGVAGRRALLSAAWVGRPVVCWVSVGVLGVTAGPLPAAAGLAGWSAAQYWQHAPIWALCRSRENSGRSRPIVEAAATSAFVLGIAPLGPALSLGSRVLRTGMTKAKAHREDLTARQKGD